VYDYPADAGAPRLKPVLVVGCIAGVLGLGLGGLLVAFLALRVLAPTTGPAARETREPQARLDSSTAGTRKESKGGRRPVEEEEEGDKKVARKDTEPESKREPQSKRDPALPSDKGKERPKEEHPSPADRPKKEEAVGLKPGQAIDEKNVKVPTKSRFNAKNVNETAEWVVSRTLDARRQGGNALRVKNALMVFNEDMKAYVGQRVEWRFTVERIFEDSIRLNQTWSTTDGSTYPKEAPNWGGDPLRRVITPRFHVLFYHEGKEVVEASGRVFPLPNSRPGVKRYIEVPGGARLVWEDDALFIGDEIDKAHALRLERLDIIKVKGKIKSFCMATDLETGVLTGGSVSTSVFCILEADRTEERKRVEKKAKAPSAPARKAEAKKPSAAQKEERQKEKEAEVDKKVVEAIEAAKLKLKSKTSKERKAGIAALAAIGEPAAEAAYDLCAVIAFDRVPALRRDALEALEKVQPKLYPLVVILALPPERGRPDGYVRAIKGLPPFGRAGLPLIVAHLQGADPNIEQLRLHVFKLLAAHAEALAKMALDDNDALKLLLALPASRLAIQSTEGGRAGEAVVRRNVAGHLAAVAKAKPETRKTIAPYFIRMLQMNDGQDRLIGANALAAFGPDAESALPALKKMNLDPAERVRKAVKDAIAAIEKKDE
jgi:hypothetical protein